MEGLNIASPLTYFFFFSSSAMDVGFDAGTTFSCSIAAGRTEAIGTCVDAFYAMRFSASAVRR